MILSVRTFVESQGGPESGQAREASTPIKVLNIFAVLRPSGAEVMFEVAGPMWASHGVESEILTLAEAPGPYTDRLASAGYKIHRLPPHPRMELLRGFAGLLRREQYDVVHIHVERANFWLAAVARARGVGVVQACHGTFQFEGALRVERTIQRAIARAVGVRYVAGSPAVERNERERFRNRTEVIGNWCDLGRYRPPSPSERDAARAQLGVRPGQFAIATVGSCAEAKNHSLLLRALTGCHELDFVYLHAGDHSVGTGLAEIGIVNESGLKARVRFLGFVDDVMPVLHAADLFVVPSRSEGSAIAAVEALGCGLPTLVSDVPGLREVAQLSSSIVAVTPTPAILAQAIVKAASVDASERPVVKMPARPVGLLDPAEGVSLYSALYRSVVRGGGKGKGSNSQ